MAEFVTIQEAYAHLRLGDYDSSGGPDDDWLAIFIPAISQAVALWLKDDWRPYVPEVASGGVVVDSSGDPIPTDVVRPVVKAAVLLELASVYRYREGEGDNRVDQAEGWGYVLNKTSTALLAPLRRPTVA
jgi:hypothetical protein